jgi:YVTN family beta-propeller protein
MYNKNSYRSHAAWGGGFMALFAIMLAMGLALATSPAEAAPFAYVANGGSNSVSAANMVVATVPVGSRPIGVGIIPP